MTANRYPFDGTRVLVTGAGSGIGRGIARAFLDNGARVAVLGRRPEPLAETLAGRDGLVLSADLTDPAAVRQAVRTVVETFGGLDVVVSNAAGYAGGDLVDLDPDAWASLRGANVDGFVHLAQAALPELERTGGNWVTVGSVSALRGDWNQSAYNATKAAVVNFTQSLALDYGRRGVRLNAVAPAFTITELTASMTSDEAAMAKFTDRIALGRPGLPADVAPAVLFLASPDAAYITGAVLTVDGGTSASTGQPSVY